MEFQQDWLGELDESQLAVIEQLQRGAVLSVIGAPGSGKTYLLRRCVAQILQQDPQARIAVLSPERRAATDIRNALTVELGVLGDGVTVQSVSAFTYGIVATYAQAIGRQAPELISGPDQDVILKDFFDLLAGGELTGLSEEFPALFFNPDVSQLPAFRTEIRELITRAAELGLSATDLAAMGERHCIPIWVSCARVMEAYENALTTQAGSGHHNPDRVDHARVVREAATIMADWDGLVDRYVGTGRVDIAQPHWDWVLVDDVQNCTLALRRLLRVLIADGASVVTFGDPDVAVQGFRGGVAQLPVLLTSDQRVGGLGARRLYLDRRYRGHGVLGQLVKDLTAGIHTAGASIHRKAAFVADTAVTEADTTVGDKSGQTRVSAIAFKNIDDQLAYIASTLRRQHLFDGVPYSQMAIITRSTASHDVVRRALRSHGVPVGSVNTNEPLREQRAVAALLALIELALADPPTITPQQMETVLTGPLISIDPLSLRQLKRELRGWSIKAGQSRTSDSLLVGLVDPDEQLSKHIAEFEGFRRAIRAVRDGVAQHALAEQVLWDVWSALGRAESWRREALSNSSLADAANRDLDAVMQLFRVAQRLADRDPNRASLSWLLADLNSHDVPEDSIARTGSHAREVTLASASSTLGREFSHVVVIELNEGQWPNLRLRNPLTRVPELVNTAVRSALAGQEMRPQQSREEVLDDELRMLVQAVSRATEEVMLCSIRSNDEIPSRFITRLFPDKPENPEKTKEGAQLPRGALAYIDDYTQADPTLDYASLVGQLRQAARHGGADLGFQATDLLARLHDDGVPEADPARWVDERELSSAGKSAFIAKSVSPSSVSSTLRCPLNAFLQKNHGTRSGGSTRANLGTLIHQIAEDFTVVDREKMLQRLDELWDGYELGHDYAARKLHGSARKMVQFLADYLEAATPHAEREVFASGTLDDITVRARMDRVEHTDVPGSVMVADFKTGKGAPTAAEIPTDPQMLIYQWLINNGHLQTDTESEKPLHGVRSAGARIVHVGSENKKLPTNIVQDAMDAESEQLAEAYIRATASLVQGPQFAAKPGNYCRSCDFTSMCPAQHGERIFS